MRRQPRWSSGPWNSGCRRKSESHERQVARSEGIKAEGRAAQGASRFGFYLQAALEARTTPFNTTVMAGALVRRQARVFTAQRLSSRDQGYRAPLNEKLFVSELYVGLEAHYRHQRRKASWMCRDAGTIV